MFKYKACLARVEFDEEAAIFHGDAVNTRAVISFQARSADPLQRELATSVEDYLAWCAEPRTAPVLLSVPQTEGRREPVIDWRQHLVSDPETRAGQLRARGTRVLVTNTLDSLAEGASLDEVLASYPRPRPEHVDAAVAYAAELAREESLPRLVS
jgi:uncharacterized protein (DUF433 family)